MYVYRNLEFDFRHGHASLRSRWPRALLSLQAIPTRSSTFEVGRLSAGEPYLWQAKVRHPIEDPAFRGCLGLMGAVIASVHAAPNDWDLSCEQVVREANSRCNQENLIEQLKNGVRALHAPVNTLNANWAYMVMASVAWSIKAWVALMLPISPRWRHRHEEDQRRLLRMDFRTFLAALINVPCQIVNTGRRIIYRLLAWNPWQRVFFRMLTIT